MANWKRYTSQHGGHVGYVNMDRVEQIYRHQDYDINYQPNGKEWTRLVTNRGGVEAVEAMSHFLPKMANRGEGPTREAMENELSHLLHIGAIECVKISIEQIVNRLMQHVRSSAHGKEDEHAEYDRLEEAAPFGGY